MGVLGGGFHLRHEERIINNSKTQDTMKFASRLLIFTVILLNICSCTEIVREKSEPTHLACWFTDKFPDSLFPGSYKIDGCCPGLSYVPNALCCFQNADGTFTIKKTSYVPVDTYLRDIAIRLIPEHGTLEDGMVFRVEDGNLEMTALWHPEHNCMASEGSLVIDKVERGTVSGTFDFSEDELWTITEGDFLLYVFSEQEY